MRLAIAADWLPTYGGAEHVLAAFRHVWPEAPIFTTVQKKSALPAELQHNVRVDKTLEILYYLLGSHPPLLPLLPRAMERMDFTGYDVVFSSSHSVGKGVIPPSTSVHVCYCHTPMRYAWEMEEEYLRDFNIRWPFRKPVKKVLKKLRRWDLTTAKRVDHFIANSSETQKRIKETYGRESVVIPPPIEGKFFEVTLPKPQGEYYLALGRLVPYKKFDLLIELANKLRLPLKIAGQGSEEKHLKSIAGPTVEFLGYVPDVGLPPLYAHAKALFFPQKEDAGIVPMEAQAMGLPIIAFGEGGVRDIVKDGETGVFASAQTLEAFTAALKTFQEKKWDRAAIRKHAEPWHEKNFEERIKKEIDDAYVRFGVQLQHAQSS